jgi:DNA polymerase-3 subunit gamma/tau
VNVIGGASVNYRLYIECSDLKRYSDVVGQEHVTKTLRNAISKGKQSPRIYI